MADKSKTGAKSGLPDWMPKPSIGRLGSLTRKGAVVAKGGTMVKMNQIPKIERVMAVGRVSVGQKVLVYIPGRRDVISAEGTRIGTKRYVQGTGYVDEENGRLVINSEALGKLKVLSPKEMRAYNKRAGHKVIPMVTAIEE